MKAYIVKNVEADGDTYVKVVDEDTFNYVLNGGVMPAGQHQLLSQQYMAHTVLKPGEWRAGTPADWLAEAQKDIADLADDFSSKTYADQERAMRVTSSDFNGAIFKDGYKDTKDILAFLQANNLTLVDEFQGLSW